MALTQDEWLNFLEAAKCGEFELLGELKSEPIR